MDQNEYEYIGIYESELEEVGILYICKKDNNLLAGDCCNVGFMPCYTHEIDGCFSIDENLQAFKENIEEGVLNE